MTFILREQEDTSFPLPLLYCLVLDHLLVSCIFFKSWQIGFRLLVKHQTIKRQTQFFCSCIVNSHLYQPHSLNFHFICANRTQRKFYYEQHRISEEWSKKKQTQQTQSLLVEEEKSASPRRKIVHKRRQNCGIIKRKKTVWVKLRKY